MKLKIRNAELTDCERMNQIFNATIGNGFSTAYTEPISPAERENWLEGHMNEKFPVLVGELNGQIICWSSLSPWRAGRQALEQVAEISYFVHPEYQRSGYGSQIMEYTIVQARRNNHTHLIAWLLDLNPASIGILKKFSFKEWGRIPKAAKLHNAVCDHLLYGRLI